MRAEAVVERLTPLEAAIALAEEEAAFAASEAEDAQAYAEWTLEIARAFVRLGWHIPGWALADGVAKQYVLGLHYGYPVCCIEAFCRDVAEDRSPGQERGGAAWIGYVPCGACRALDGPESPSDAPAALYRIGRTPKREGGA